MLSFEIRRGGLGGRVIWAGVADNWLAAVTTARVQGTAVNLGNTDLADYVIQRRQMRFVNLTPHEITLSTPVGGIILPSAGVARREEKRVVAGRLYPSDPVEGLNDSIDIESVTYGAVTGLPLPAEGTAYIVSQLVASAVPSRWDVFFPGRLIRDAAGRPAGCTTLASCWDGYWAGRPTPPAPALKCAICGDEPDPTQAGLGIMDQGTPGGLSVCGDLHRWVQVQSGT